VSEKQLETSFGFYRLQYGINFRRWNGKSYSAKDPVSQISTRNIGVIMEAAVDSFSQELVQTLALTHSVQPNETLAENLLFKDSTGQITVQDIASLKAMEKETSINLESGLRNYLKALRLFNQYVTYRYRNFLSEVTPNNSDDFHLAVIEGTLSGQMRQLVKLLDVILQRKHAFRTMFKSPDY
jgi:hypothetical protein